MLRGLPESQHFRTARIRLGCPHFGSVEQSLIQSQILGGRRKRQFKPFHTANRLLVGVCAAVAPWTIRRPDLD